MRVSLPTLPTAARHLGVLAALLVLGLALGAGPARADDPAGGIQLTFVDDGGATLTGACYEVWTEVAGEYGLLVKSLCNTTGSNAVVLAPGRYVVHETQPPLLRVPPGGLSEPHVYRKAPDAHATVFAGQLAGVALVHQQGARLDVQAVLPSGSPAGSACFTARIRATATVVDEACGIGGPTTLWVAAGDLAVEQTMGPGGYGLAPGAQVTTVLDGQSTLTMTMRPGTAGGTIRVAQQNLDGAAISGGCWSLNLVVSGGREHIANACAENGIVRFDDLDAGRYELDEYQAPSGFAKADDLSATLGAGGEASLAARHRPLPVVTVRTVDAAGNAVAGACWIVKWPDSAEAEAGRACDGDDSAADGSTRFRTLEPDAYELVQTSAPAGWERVESRVPFALAGEDVVVTVTLQRIEPPANVAAPSVAGEVRAGAPLTGSRGEWTGSAPIAYALQWLRCDTAGDGCAPIAGANGTTYTPTSADGGSRFRLSVSASNRGGHSNAASAPTAPLVLSAPVAGDPPGITGAVQLGFQLYGQPGSWTGRQPIALALQWLRCDPVGEACSAIAGATGDTYAPTDADVGSTFRLAVSAENADGVATARSAATRRLVRIDPPVNLSPPQVAGAVRIGVRLDGTPGRWYSPGTSSGERYRWVRCDAAGESCVAIPGGEGNAYTITFGDVGHKLRFEVEASNPGGVTVARSAATVLVELTPPAVIRRPEIRGTVRVNARLEGLQGEFYSTTGSTDLTYQWLRCDAAGAQCEPIRGAIFTLYSMSDLDVGHTLRFQVRAYDGRSTTLAASAATALLEPLAPVNTARPEVIGAIKLGSRLEGREGQWTSPTGRLGLFYRWLRCDAAGESCTPIPGGAGNLYTLTSEDVGHTLRYEVRAESGQAVVTLTSRATLPLRLAPPINIRRPQITGSFANGILLNGTNGEWASTTGRLSLTYQWLRCNLAGEACAPIAGATGLSYRVTAADLARRLRVQVRAENGEGVTLAVSDATGLATTPPPVNYRLPEVRGLAQPGVRLSTTQGEWATQPGRTTYTYRWLLCDAGGERCTAIPGETGTSIALTTGHAGSSLRFEVRAEASGGTTVALSERTQLVEVVRPVNTTLPVVQGAIKVGGRLNGTYGDWLSGTGRLGQTFQWERCNAAGADCADIPGANTTSYTLTTGDAGTTLRFRVRADNGQAVATARSWPTQVLELSPPVNYKRPEAIGTMRLGSRLNGIEGGWLTLPGWTTYTYRWLRCDAAGEACAPIPYGIGTSYALNREDAGHTLRYEVRAETNEGVTTARSAATQILELFPPVNSVRPEARGEARVGGRLDGTNGEWFSSTGSTSLTYRWLRCDAAGGSCTAIPGAIYLSYEPTAADVGARLRLEVRAENAEGWTTARADASAVVS